MLPRPPALLPFLFSVLLTGYATAQPAETSDLFERAAARVEAQEADLIAVRHDLHRQPELSGEEERTAGVVADRLAALSFEVRTGIGGHGVIGVLEGARPGPMVAFRADMDAVRSSAPDPVPYRSIVPGVRHICGHDMHTAIGLGLAEGLAGIRDDLAGSVMLVFQPAEERGTGAKAMLRDGAWEATTPDAIFALHTAPLLLGQLATAPGGMMAGRASLSVTLSGSGDLQAAATRVREAVEGVGTIPPQEAGQMALPGFVLVQLAPVSVSDEEAVVRGQIMTAGLADRARAKTATLEALGALDLPGITVETQYDERWMEGVNNDADLVEHANASIARLASEITVWPVPGAVPAFSEDFGSFQARTPGVMYFLGVNNPETGTVGMPHSPEYVADDAALLIGTRAMLAAILGRLAVE